MLCAFAMLACELVSRPFSSVGFCDDGPYILMAETLSRTGHLVYNGWASAMIAAQLYLADVFIKLFGFSYTTVRMSTLLVAVLTAFLVQRTFFRSGISERNSTIGTLILVLSPIYLMLSATFMSDIFGLFGILLCLYGCIRALQASSNRSAALWLLFAVMSSAISGTSRQIAWLGVLVMVPCTLWLLRSHRRVVLAGAVATFCGAIFIVACMHWLKLQPYVIPVPLLVKNFPKRIALRQVSYILLEVPFLILPIFAVFIPQLRKSRPATIAAALAVLLGYLLIAIPTRDSNPLLRLEPTAACAGSWLGVHGVFEGLWFRDPPVFLHTNLRVLLTIVSLGGLLSVFAVVLQRRPLIAVERPPATLSWRQVGFLLLPFSLAYIVFLAAATGTTMIIFDRYALGILGPVLLCLIRYYQERISMQLPASTLLLVGVMAIYGICVTHNAFALGRGRAEIAAELRSNGVPETAVDNGWEHNLEIELQHADHLNHNTITVPANAYVAVPRPPADTCAMFWFDRMPHIQPVYGVSFAPDFCHGVAPFAPVHYSRWPFLAPGTLYVVRYSPEAKR